LIPQKDEAGFCRQTTGKGTPARLTLALAVYDTSASGRNGEPVAPCNFSGIPRNVRV
jgi:hypothetical protein